MEWSAFFLSLCLSLFSVTILLVLGLLIARSLAWKRFVGKGVIEALITLPLVLPPHGFRLLFSSFSGPRIYVG